MAALSRLVEFRNKVERLTNDLEDNSQFSIYLSKISDLKIEFVDLLPDELDSVADGYVNLLHQHQVFNEDLRNYINKLNSNIDLTAEQNYNTHEYSQILKEEYMPKEANAVEHSTTISAKIAGYSDWRYPCLHIMPKYKQFVDSSVSGDPLYLIDIDIDSIKNLISPYPELYQRRLRLYELKDRNLTMLPQSQFGFVFCWEVFDYLCPSVVEGYLRQIFNLLRPGGVVMFSYPNCDNEVMARRAETSAVGYNSTRRVSKLANEIGYNIINLIELPNDNVSIPYTSWAELKKPGELTTIKRHQPLAEIIEK